MDIHVSNRTNKEMEPVIKIFPTLDTNTAFEKQFDKELHSRIQSSSIYEYLHKKPILLISRMGTRSLDGLEEHFQKVLPKDEKDRHDVLLFIQNDTLSSTVDIPNYTLRKVFEVAWSNEKKELKEVENKKMFADLATILFTDFGYKFQVLKELEDQTLKIKEEMKLEMKVAFPLECDYMWLKDDLPVDKDRYVTSQKEETYTLSVEQAEIKDIGKYTLKIGNVLQSSFVLIRDPPGAPENLRIASTKKHLLDLQWNEPKNSSESPIRAYIIERRGKDDTWTEKACTLNTSFPVFGFKEGEQFRVRAVNDSGWGEHSNETEPLSTNLLCSPPDSPRDLNVEQLDRFSYQLEWKEPQEGSEVLGYFIERKLETEWCKIKGSEGTKCTVYIKPIPDFVELRVTAVNNVGHGNPSNSVKVQVKDFFTSPEHEERVLRAVVNPRLAKKKTCCSWICSLLWHIVWFLTCGFCRRSLVPITKEKLRKELDKIERGETSLEEKINDKFELYPGQLQEMIRRKLDEPYSPVSRSEKSRLLP